MSPSKTDIEQRRILIVGDIMLDRYWFGSVDRISPEAPVPIVRVVREEERMGGAANVALNVRTLGARATLLSCVGRDDAATRLRKLLLEKGVDAILGDDDKLQTIVKLRIIGHQQQLLRIDFETVPEHEVLAQMLEEYVRQLPNHDAVLFSDYGKGGLTHIAEMIQLARQQWKPVLVDPKGSDYTKYAGATVITPNRTELAQVVGPWRSELELYERAQKMRTTLGLEGLLLTRSEEGMTLFESPESTTVRTEAREVADVTGAGDTVIATMAVMVASGLSLRDAMDHANRAAGLVVAKFGTASVSYEEIFS